MRDRPPIKYPLGDWVNNRNNSLEEQVTETQKAIDQLEFMIANDHPSTHSLKQELVPRYSRLNALKDVLENPRLGKEQSNVCRKIVQGVSRNSTERHVVEEPICKLETT